MREDPRFDFPSLKVISFWQDNYDEENFYQIMRDYRMSGGDQSYALDFYHLWQSETFGDWWEIKIVGNTFGRGARAHYGLFAVDKFRPLCMGETFKAIRRNRLSKRQKERRQQLRQQGKIEYQVTVSEEELRKALRELVSGARAILRHRKRL